MMINLYIADLNTISGYRPATLDESECRIPNRPPRTTSIRGVHIDLRRLPSSIHCCQDLFRGTIDGASVHPREVVKEALRNNAAACILARVHPSGVAEPSAADEAITRRLRDALGLVDVRVLDHVIVAGGDTTSFAQRGLL